MKKNNNKVLFGIGAGVVIVVLILVLVFRDTEERFNWVEEHKYDKEQPYDNDLIYKLLKARVDKDSFIHMMGNLATELEPSAVNGPASYIYIGNANYYTDDDVDSLMEFVALGHNAFISVNEFSYGLGEKLEMAYCSEYDGDDIYRFKKDTLAALNLNHPKLKLKEPVKYVYKPFNKAQPYEWQYFFIESWCESTNRVAKLGTVNKYPNFIRIPHGDGFFYLHSSPIAFSNFYMRDSLALAYAQNVFAHLPDGSIYWDEGSRYWHYQDGEGGRNASPFGQSQLKYILGEPAMRWAFYTLLAGVMLYIMFYMKRRQKIIPVVEPYANTSVEYVQTVGGLYFLKQEHQKLADQQFKLFLSFVRNRYRLSTQTLDEALIKRLTTTSKVEEEKVRYIFTVHQAFTQLHAITEDQLIGFNKSLEYFYQNCK
ncbi:hypothetical protein BH09BAC1_BH09BAC1_04700 [soil metagenome]